MIKANYHTHTRFCHAIGEPKEYIERAIELGFKALGFSSHAPLPFYQSYVMPASKLEEYCTEIRELQTQYKDQLQIYLGLEVDFISGLVGPNQYPAGTLDYIIGSVHILKGHQANEYICLDESPGEFTRLAQQAFRGDYQALVQSYYAQVREMIQCAKPDVLGHLDIVKKFNADNYFFNELSDWYRVEIMKTLHTIAESGVILEVNTGGIARGFVRSPYPSPWILIEAQKLEIPIMLASDAHSPNALNYDNSEIISVLQQSGYNCQRILLDRKWQDILL